MLKIYHNPRCAKSREGLNYLRERNISFEVVEYFDTPLQAGDLRRILMKLNMKPAQVVRTQEALFKAELKGRTFTDEEWISIILENPRLLQRPIVEGKYKAVIAVPPDKIDELNK